MTWILVVQLITSTGSFIDFKYEVNNHGSLNLQYCYNYRNAVRIRAKQLKDEIIHIDCHLGA